MTFARWVFWVAGASGVLMILPMYAEAQVFSFDPPPINRPEFYYAFVGVCLAWQVGFLIIGSDPVRHRPMMLAAMIEKITFVVAALGLWWAGRVETHLLGAASMDGTWFVLFLIAWRRTPAS